MEILGSVRKGKGERREKGKERGIERIAAGIGEE
jgi:hypothetical protein